MSPNLRKNKLKRTRKKGEKGSMRIKGKTALITGGTLGIGKATAKLFIEQGADVFVCGRNKEVGEKAAKEIGCTYNQVDVSDRQAVQNWVEEVAGKTGRIDILVNNAGITRDGLLVKVKDGELVKQLPEEDFDLVVSVNLKGTFNCTQAVAPFMIMQGSGSIINASSVVGLDGNFGQTGYVATKAGIVGMTKVWAREFGRFNVRVNAIAPGSIQTDILESMPEKYLTELKKHQPLGRFGTPEEVASATLFLASDDASFVSGTTLRIDGALVLGT
jgi:3-oxoacyl-[acyl-carrier protein] reductase